ncbi:hypothetical protein [Phaeovulum sp.]|uniref:hypothetical protein n=1 Tax=Phaeovulum sp. TaxID=2934796 RepID=UPI0039E549C9
MIPGVGSDTTQIVALMAMFAAALTFFEYASAYPGLVEFRDAPPFNRIRFVSLLVTVMLLSIVVTSHAEPTTLTRFVEVLGASVAQSIDVPYSPVRLLVLMLPADADVRHIDMVRTAGGISYIISLITLGYFVVILRTIGWPHSIGGFNVWVNLPTFDPTAGGDVVDRLRRDAWFNVGLGFVLPFVIPALVKLVSTGFSPVTLESPQTMVWTVSAWAFLPASLFMRGIAMGRIATMIEQQREQEHQDESSFATA